MSQEDRASTREKRDDQVAWRFPRLVTEQGVSLPPESFNDIVLLAMLTTEHEEDVYAVSPPHWVFKGLAGLGRLLGYHLPAADKVENATTR
jgi:hypothetical protein